ncbi:hypothetical protein BGW41_000888 [Actinomortierella wolfii]|nr:hypothetical protein BGW41_000888 [Actinomortierella wolfii]
MLDDLVLHVRREIALDGASGCTWERFWYLIATEQERLFALSSLAKTKSLPTRQPGNLVPDEKYRRYFWGFFLRVKGPVYYIYNPPAGTTPVTKKPTEAALVPMEHLTPISSDQLSYDNVVTKYKDTLRIAPTIEYRNQVICGMPTATINFSAAALDVLQLVVSKRERGISQSLLSKELGKDPKTIFHFVKTLIKANMLVKIPISEAGAFTQLVLYKPLARLHPGYCQWIAETSASTSNRKPSSVATPIVPSTPSSTSTDNQATHVDSSYYNSISKLRVLSLLRKAKGNVMVTGDLALALGLPPTPQRTVQQRRFFVRLLQQLVTTGHIVRVMSEEHGRCIQLAQSANGASSAAQATSSSAELGETNDLIDTLESEADAQLDVNQLIDKEASSRRGMEVDTSIEYQIVRYVIQSGANGATHKEIMNQFGLTTKKLIDKFLDVLTRSRKSGGPALLKRVAELNGRQHLYRYFSTRGYEENLGQHQIEYVEKAGLTTDSTTQYQRSKARSKRRAAGSSTKSPSASKNANVSTTLAEDTEVATLATGQTVSPSPSVVAAPSEADTISSVEPSLSPTSISESPSTPMEFDGMPPPPPAAGHKGKSKAHTSDSASRGTAARADTTGTPVSTVPPASPSSKITVDLSALERREILLDIINESRIIEFGQAMINEYQRKMQARNPGKKVTTKVDRKTLSNYSLKLEEEGKCKTITQSTITATGKTIQRKFLLHVDEDPESEKIRMYIEGCLSQRTYCMAAMMRPDRKEKVEFKVERLQELTERLQEEMPQPLALPAAGLTKETNVPKVNSGETSVYLEQIATKYGFRKPRMVRVRHFHEYIFRMAQATPTAEDKEPIIKTHDLFVNMPLHVFLISVGIDKELATEEQSLWLLENASSDTPLKDLPLGLSSLAEPTIYFKRRMRELLEVLDALELVTPLLPRSSVQGAISASTLYPDGFVMAQNHMALNPFYHVHLWVDPGLVHKVKVKTVTRMKLQSTMDLQNYWITVMRITQYSGTIDDNDEAVKDEIVEADDVDLLSDMCDMDNADNPSKDVSTVPADIKGAVNGDDDQQGSTSISMHIMIRRVMKQWDELKVRLLNQLYNRRNWMLCKTVTPAQAAILDKFCRYDERQTPVQNPDMLVKAAHAAGVATHEARKHYLMKINYYNQKARKGRLRTAAGNSDEEGDSFGTIESIQRRKSIKERKTKRAGGKRLASTQALNKQEGKDKQKDNEVKDKTTLRSRVTSNATNDTRPRNIEDIEDDSGQDEDDKDYEDEENEEEEEIDDEEETGENAMLREDMKRRRRGRRIPWTSLDDDNLMILCALVHHISGMLHTRISWKGVDGAFPGRIQDACRRRVGVLRKNPINAARLRLYKKKWARIFTKADRELFLTPQNEIRDAQGLLKVWYERQELVHISEDVIEEPTTHSQRFLNTIDLPLHVADLHVKYSVISSSGRQYPMFYIDEKSLYHLSLPQKIAMIAAWPTMLRAVSNQELDLRFEELEDLLPVSNELESLLLPKAPKPDWLSSRPSEDGAIVVKPSGRERFRDEHIILTLWKSVFHLPANEIALHHKKLRNVLSFFPPDKITSTSSLGKEWKVFVRKRTKGSRIPGQPLCVTERFTGVMLGAISRVRSNNASEFIKALYPVNGGGSSGIAQKDRLKAQFDFDPQLNASQMMAMIHALESNHLVFSASTTELSNLDYEVLPRLTATVLDKHAIGQGSTSSTQPSVHATKDSSTKKLKTRKRIKEEEDGKGDNDTNGVGAAGSSAGTDGKRLRESGAGVDSTGEASSGTPQTTGAYRNWEEVMEVSKAELYKYLATIPDAGRREVFEKVYDVVAATGAQGIVMVDIKDTILKVPFTHTTHPSDKEILDTVKTLETLFPPALIKVGLSVARYVVNGFQMPWTVNAKASEMVPLSPSTKPSELRAEILSDEMDLNIMKSLNDTDTSYDQLLDATWSVTGARQEPQYTQVQLEDYKAPRMWRSVDGEWNAITFEKLCHSVLTHIVQSPGITRGSLELSFRKIVLPVELDELLEELETRRGAIISRGGRMPPRASLFSKRAVFKPCDPRQTIDKRLVTMFFPNTASGKAYYEFLDMTLVRAHHTEDIGALTLKNEPRIRTDGTRGSTGANGRRQRRQTQAMTAAMGIDQEQSQRRTTHDEDEEDAHENNSDGSQVLMNVKDKLNAKGKEKANKASRPRGRPLPSVQEFTEPLIGESVDMNEDTYSGEGASVSTTPVTATGKSGNSISGGATPNQSTINKSSSGTSNQYATDTSASAAELSNMAMDGERAQEDEDEDEDEEELTLRRRGTRVLHSDVEDVDEAEDRFSGVVDDEDDEQILLHLDEDEEEDEDDDEGMIEDEGDVVYTTSEAEGAPAYKKQRSSV